MDQMIPQMARVAGYHSLGVLVIDELQRLIGIKVGGSSKMLNQLVRLENVLGMPVVLVGTYRALPLLNGDLRQARRSAGQGDLVWHRMEQDKEWREFLETLWTYQYVRNSSPLADGLSDVLYDETQGITDFVVKVYMLAQTRAIASEKEVVDEAMIRSVAADSLVLAQPILDALRADDKKALEQFGDAYLDLGQLMEREISRGNGSGQGRVSSSSGAGTGLANAEPSADAQSQGAGVEAAESEKDRRRAGRGTGKGKGKRAKRQSATVQEGLLGVAASAVDEKSGLHDMLTQAGLIAPGTEFLQGDKPS